MDAPRLLTASFVVCALLTSSVYAQARDSITCANLMGSISHINEDGALEDVSTGPYKVCNDTTYCYTIWQEDPVNGNITIMGQGCWDLSGKPKECERSECIADKEPPRAKNNTKFCCCSEDMCNTNFTNAYVPESEAPLHDPDLSPKSTIPLVVWIIIAVLFAFLIVTLAVTIYFTWQRKPKKNDIEIGQTAITPPADLNLDNLKLIRIIGQGKYGCVWRGVIDEQEVAVKVFPSHHRNYFLSEYEAYKVAGENPALLKCLGGGEHAIIPGDFMLIFGLEQECLQDYLRNHTVNMATMCKMGLGIAKGLAHLHSDLGKPCIAHRDINTRNILVRRDLTCCVCDLGLAVIPKLTESNSLSEAGTLRYMAPEVLQGAVNLRDCECALKQIDVYALGLVLWELGSRCTDMQNAEPQPYAPPFYKEAGENPSLEQMQTLVSLRKARPLWPVSWKDTVAARLLCETAEDCWDQDAEARLTSLCVVERLLELPTLKGRVLHPFRPPSSPTSLINNNHIHDHQLESSIGTIETLLSPSEENCKNSNQLVACAVQLQPYQGRNPCMERNLLLGSSDSLLIDKSSKHCNNSESQNLISSDYLEYQVNQRIGVNMGASPIPYLQNAVHGGPKQENTASAGDDDPNPPRSSKFKWNFKKLFHGRGKPPNGSLCKETEVKLKKSNKLRSSFGRNGVTTSLLNDYDEPRRPSTLSLAKTNASPPSETGGNTSGVTQIMRGKNVLSRQHSLEHFSEVFSSTSDLSRLKDLSQRVKTPGDVPPSVRRTRGKAAKDSVARFSLYDDSVMCRGQWGSAPDLDPPVPLKLPQLSDLQDRDSVSSF